MVSFQPNGPTLFPGPKKSPDVQARSVARPLFGEKHKQTAPASPEDSARLNPPAKAASSGPLTEDVTFLEPPSAAVKPPMLSKLLGNNTRTVLGVILEDVIPPMLGFAFLSGPLGWVITLGSFPLSYASGKLGKHIARDINHEALPPTMRKFQDFRAALKNNQNFNGEEVIEKWNHFIGDALNIKTSRFKALNQMLSSRLSLSKNGFIGRLLNNPAFMKAKMYNNVAHADTVSGAIKAGARGGIGFWFYHSLLPGIGRAMEKMSNWMPGPLKLPFKGIGWLVAHFSEVQLAKDVMLSSAKKSPTA